MELAMTAAPVQNNSVIKKQTPMKGRKDRKLKDSLLYGLMAGAVVLVLTILGFILVYIISQAAGYLNFKFLFGSAQSGGILPMAVTTLYVVITSLVIALPIGVMTAIFLNEYAGDSSPVRLLRLAIETLAGIPSILYGLFGLLVFCRVLGFGQSIIAGACTLSIMILPVIIRTTEESLKTIPVSFREGSLSLGATKFQTIRHVVLPSAMPGIVTSAILAIGRVVGESAPVLLTVGIAKNIPKSIFESGRTLTIHLYYLTKEAINPDDFGHAFATAAVLIIMVIIINSATRIISSRFGKKQGGGA
ncbi:phosphate ABC transporter permease PstA [Brucepastera parasyntrophica]|uniref:phosphate ABC transporter permease PstA n=1 Tax=Brucepastera parasyntrophica TaxID=2880008 RepID=UPI00210AD7A0|nr:phosphate ABC transporter permease PstA [Brucepastera parasyntrophica]ULQ60669.1 phosphate ABC transporter permease PstA [Brucepastera parasyntrophica]